MHAQLDAQTTRDINANHAYSASSAGVAFARACSSDGGKWSYSNDRLAFGRA